MSWTTVGELEFGKGKEIVARTAARPRLFARIVGQHVPTNCELDAFEISYAFTNKEPLGFTIAHTLPAVLIIENSHHYLNRLQLGLLMPDGARLLIDGQVDEAPVTRDGRMQFALAPGFQITEIPSK